MTSLDDRVLARFAQTFGRAWEEDMDGAGCLDPFYAELEGSTMIDQAFADQQTAAYNATLNLHGNVFGIRFFGYGACVVYKLSNPEKSAFLQGEEAYELWEQADNAPNSIARDNLLDRYIDY